MAESRTVLRSLLLLALCCVGCRPIVGDRDRNPLFGEWQVDRSEGPARDFFIITLDAEGVTIFSNGDQRGTYTIEGDRLTVRIPGYPALAYTILRREGGFDLRDDAKGTTYFLKDRNGFDAAGFFGPLLLGVLGLVILVPEARALGVYVRSSRWPEIRAEVLDARVVVEKHERHVHRATDQEEAWYEVERDGIFRDKIRWSSVLPQVTFRYAVEGRAYVASNEASWNHAASYTPQDAARWVERWQREGLAIRYDPGRPERVFLGGAHFPLVTSILFALAGTALSLGLAAVVKVVAGWVNLELLKVGSADWTVLVVLGALPVYLALTRLLGR